MLRLGFLASISVLVACGAPTTQASTPEPDLAPIVPPPARSAQDARTVDAGPAVPADSPGMVLTPTPGAEAASVKGISDKLKFVTGDTAFGGGKSGKNSYVGLVFRTQAAPTTLPDFSKMKPIGAVYTDALAIAPGTAFEGFPGVDKARATEFALRYEAPLNVGTEGIYEVRLVSDDGARLFIDEMKIIDNDGVAASAPREGKASVHLVKAKHSIRIDYFQATGTVALQLFVTPPGGKEEPLRTNLH